MNIRQVVRLKQLLKKWQNNTNNDESNKENIKRSKSKSGSRSSSTSPRKPQAEKLANVSNEQKKTNLFWRSKSLSNVPHGYLAVYVGDERTRFVIPTSYLQRPAFKDLLDKAAEEFGFCHAGGLCIPCDVSSFQQLISEECQNIRKDRYFADPLISA